MLLQQFIKIGLMPACLLPELCNCCHISYFKSVSVHFRFIVFRPFIGEVLVGKIRSSSSDGLRGKMFSNSAMTF